MTLRASKEENMQVNTTIQGDAARGVAVNHDLTGIAKAQITLKYAGKVAPPPGMHHYEIECEIYEVDGLMSVHTVCPKCRHATMISGKVADISYDKNRGLFVSKFECPWEMGGKDDHTEFGIGLCKLVLAYEGKVARDA
jgi:hypothetical protein